MPPKNKEPRRLSNAAFARMAQAMLDEQDAEEQALFGAHFERHRAPPPHEFPESPILFISRSPTPEPSSNKMGKRKAMASDDQHVRGASPTLSDLYGQSPTGQETSFVEDSSMTGTGATSSSNIYSTNAFTAPPQRSSTTKATTVKDRVGTKARGKTGTDGGAGSEAKNPQTIKHYFEVPPMEFSSRTETPEMNRLKRSRIEAEKAKEAAARAASGVDMEGEASGGGQGMKRKRERVTDRNYENRTKRRYQFKDRRPLKGLQQRGKGKGGKVDMREKGGKGDDDDGDYDGVDSDDDDDDDDDDDNGFVR